MFLAAGTRLDKYEIVAPLAVGGMAELYVARSRGIQGFEKLCVLKRILPQYARDHEFVQMFLDEARLAATLHHPNVIQVYDIGEAGGRYYFTMEYVHGQDVAAIVAMARAQGRGLRVQHAIAIAAGVAAGLHHAHEQIGDGKPLGIVHRDVSPTNVLVSYDGNVKVVDFGIAKAAARGTHTTAGGAKGKLSYMSPEQVRADRTLDRRSDIFSLGVVLYELTTGRALFRGDSDFVIAEQILEGEVPRPTAVRASYPPALEAIVMKALARSPADRFQTAREMQLALESFANEERLPLSSVGISEYMSSLFSDQVQAWSAAQRDGTSLVDYVTAVMETRLSSAHAVTPSRRGGIGTVLGIAALVAAVVGWIIVFQQRGGRNEPERPGEAKADDTKPGSGEAKPSGGDATPGVGEVKPASKPTAGEPKPTTGEVKPSEARVPASGSDPPAADEVGASNEAAIAGHSPVPETKGDRAPGRKAAKQTSVRKTQPAVEPPPIDHPAAGSANEPAHPAHPGLDDRLNPFKPPPKP